MWFKRQQLNIGKITPKVILKDGNTLVADYFFGEAHRNIIGLYKVRYANPQDWLNKMCTNDFVCLISRSMMIPKHDIERIDFNIEKCIVEY